MIAREVSGQAGGRGGAAEKPVQQDRPACWPRRTGESWSGKDASLHARASRLVESEGGLRGVPAGSLADSCPLAPPQASWVPWRVSLEPPPSSCCGPRPLGHEVPASPHGCHASVDLGQPPRAVSPPLPPFFPVTPLPSPGSTSVAVPVRTETLTEQMHHLALFTNLLYGQYQSKKTVELGIPMA